LNEFSKTLRQLARKCGKSEYDLARLSGLDPSFVHRLMSGEKNPSLATVTRLAMALVMDKELADQYPADVPNALGILVTALLSDATAKSVLVPEATRFGNGRG
jgi:transcriptional regulator with XRE-family HTH domain